MSYPIFDVTATNLIKTADVNLKSITMETCDKNLNLVPSEAGFSAVSGAKVSGFILFVDFVHHRLNAKVCAFNYWFCGKMRCLYKHTRNQTKRFQIEMGVCKNTGQQGFGTVRRPRICSLTY